MKLNPRSPLAHVIVLVAILAILIALTIGGAFRGCSVSLCPAGQRAVKGFVGGSPMFVCVPVAVPVAVTP